jgi:DNA-binding transcriptional MerR regulator
MNIKQAADASGVDPDTIRFYERSGVLPRPPRSANGYRDYSEAHLATLQLVRGLRHLGLSLEEMQRMAAVSHDVTCGELRSTLMEELRHAAEETARRIQELEHTRRHVERLLSGLERMRPRERRVPGSSPCGCVRLVGAKDPT